MQNIRIQDIILLSRLTNGMTLTQTTEIIEVVDNIVYEAIEITERDVRHIYTDKISHLEHKNEDLQRDVFDLRKSREYIKDSVTEVVNKYFKVINYYQFIRHSQSNKNSRINRIKIIRAEFPTLSLKAAKDIDEFYYTKDGYATMEGLEVYGMLQAAMNRKIDFDLPQPIITNNPNIPF